MFYKKSLVTQSPPVAVSHGYTGDKIFDDLLVRRAKSDTGTNLMSIDRNSDPVVMKTLSLS